jgi:hypothetical protein
MKDRIPAWLQISREEAARQIARAMYRRERERIITGHGRIAVFLQRHCPRLMSGIIARMGAKGLV